VYFKKLIDYKTFRKEMRTNEWIQYGIGEGKRERIKS